MSTSVSPLERIGLVYGALTMVGLLVFFLLMKFLGLAHIIELRFFNVLILALGIVLGIKRLKKELHEEEFYLKGLAVGMFITGLATIAFAFFISLYMVYVDHALLEQIRSSVTMRDYVNGVGIFVAVSLEGGAAGLIISFAAMQYYKRQKEG